MHGPGSPSSSHAILASQTAWDLRYHTSCYAYSECYYFICTGKQGRRLGGICARFGLSLVNPRLLPCCINVVRIFLFQFFCNVLLNNLSIFYPHDSHGFIGGLRKNKKVERIFIKQRFPIAGTSRCSFRDQKIILQISSVFQPLKIAAKFAIKSLLVGLHSGPN